MLNGTNYASQAIIVEYDKATPLIIANDCAFANILGYIQKLQSLLNPFGGSGDILQMLLNQLNSVACQSVQNFMRCLPFPSLNLNIGLDANISALTCNRPNYGSYGTGGQSLPSTNGFSGYFGGVSGGF